MASNYSIENNIGLNKMFCQLDRLKYNIMAGLSEANIEVDKRAWETQTQSGGYARVSSFR